MKYKHDYDKTLTRLTVILKKLYEGEALSVSDLAKEFNVSIRTVQRDFNERLTSFPIIKKNKKWRMEDGFKIEKTNDIKDIITLNIMSKMAESVGVEFASRAKKLLSKIQNEEYNPIYTKLDIEDISDKLNEIKLLEDAIKSKQVIKCQYMVDSSFEISVKPLKIANYEGFWYLLALDLKNDKLKKYYLKNISNIHIKKMTFETTTELNALLDNSISIWFNENRKPYDVKLFISNEAAKYFQRKPISKTQVLESVHQDGSIIIHLKITSDMEILPLVKYWIPFIKVLEPKRIDELVKNELEGYLKDYSETSNQT